MDPLTKVEPEKPLVPPTPLPGKQLPMEENTLDENHGTGDDSTDTDHSETKTKKRKEDNIPDNALKTPQRKPPPKVKESKTP